MTDYFSAISIGAEDNCGFDDNSTALTSSDFDGGATATGSDDDDNVGRHPTRRRMKGSARHADAGAAGGGRGQRQRQRTGCGNRCGPRGKWCICSLFFCLASLTVVSLFRFNLSPLELGGEAGDSDSCNRGSVFLQLAAAAGGSVSNPHYCFAFFSLSFLTSLSLSLSLFLILIFLHRNEEGERQNAGGRGGATAMQAGKR